MNSVYPDKFDKKIFDTHDCRHLVNYLTIFHTNNNDLYTKSKKHKINQFLCDENSNNRSKIDVLLSKDLLSVIFSFLSFKEYIKIGAVNSYWFLSSKKNFSTKLNLTDFRFNLTDDILRNILKKYPHLLELNLHSCFLLTDHIIDIICESCKHLEILNLSGCDKLTNKGVTKLLSQSKLDTLILYGFRDINSDSDSININCNILY